jgi:hypothetical protein
LFHDFRDLGLPDKDEAIKFHAIDLDLDSAFMIEEISSRAVPSEKDVDPSIALLDQEVSVIEHVQAVIVEVCHGIVVDLRQADLINIGFKISNSIDAARRV